MRDFSHLRTPPDTPESRQAIEKARERLKRRMDAKLVTQEASGKLRVNPQQLYVDETTGKRALADLRRRAPGQKKRK